MSVLKRSAIVSEDGLYRYYLTREWGDAELLTFVMLNPSTADAMVDDPTIRRCCGFARREGFSGIQVINLFALRTTKPIHLLDHPDPEGPKNSAYWKHALEVAGDAPIVAAWGAGARSLMRKGIVSTAIDDNSPIYWQCLGHTKDMDPRHPLYLKSDAPLEPW